MKYTYQMIFHPGRPPGGAAERCRGEGDLEIPANSAAATLLTGGGGDGWLALCSYPSVHFPSPLLKSQHISD